MSSNPPENISHPSDSDLEMLGIDPADYRALFEELTDPEPLTNDIVSDEIVASFGVDLGWFHSVTS